MVWWTIGILTGLGIIIGYFIFIYKPPIKGPAEILKFNIGETLMDGILNSLEQINSTTYEFDVIMSSQQPINITSYQCSLLLLNESIINGGTLSFSYIPGTSDFVNNPQNAIGVNTSEGNVSLTFASGPGSDTVNGTLRIGRFRLENTVAFTDTPNLQWDFDGPVNTIFTGDGFTDITQTITFRSGDMAVIISTEQKVQLTLEPLSGLGNPAPVDGVPTWDASPAGIVTLDVAPDGMSAFAIGTAVGSTVVTATADADMTPGLRFISGSIDIDVFIAEAQTLQVIAGTPEPI